jgi:hypothetical protein
MISVRAELVEALPSLGKEEERMVFAKLSPYGTE